jgi:hypothetical protein
LLQFLVRKVDAELLKGIVVEKLKAENIQDSDKAMRAAVVLDGSVNDFHKVQEQISIQGLSQGISGIRSLQIFIKKKKRIEN